MGERTSLAAMLEARSVAVIGASARPGSFGEQMMLQLTGGGFSGTVLPVNPAYAEIMGFPCAPSVDALPEPPDLALLGVKNAQLEETLKAVAAAGARSAVIYASCYEPPGGGLDPLPVRLARVATDAGMALCGGNCMGFVNFDRQLRACGFPEPEGLEPGPITFITHSGSAFSALLHNDRRLRFNLAVSSGTEMVTTAADYLAYSLDRESTRVVALFIETIRDPGLFLAGLARAGELNVPVVALKVGREAQAKELVTAHSGALAGEDGAYEAVFDRYGVLRVSTLDEMADTLELFAAGRRAAPGRLAAIHDSGGERALLIDSAADAGVPLARISEATRARLAAVLEEGLPPVNPLDAWGTGNRADDIFIECMHALLDDPDAGALAFCVDLTTELVPQEGYTKVAVEVFGRTDKPVAVLSNMSAAIDPRDAGFVRDTGIPVLQGTVSGLAAFRHLFDYRDFHVRPPVEVVDPPPLGVIERWRGRLRSGTPLTEVEALALLAAFGIPVAPAASAASLPEALHAADRVGWPVALKTATPGVAHKSDAGGVRLGLAGPEELRAAYGELSARLGPGVTVARMASPGVELALGVVRDEQFGPLVMVASGGVLIEIVRDRRFGLPPFDRAAAMRLIDRLAMRPLLDGARGATPADVAAIATTVAALSTLAVALGEDLDALDVNPLIAGPEGCVAVDALVVPRE